MPQRVSLGCVRIPEISPPASLSDFDLFREENWRIGIAPYRRSLAVPFGDPRPPMFPEGTKPVAGRWRATTGLQVKKRMHPGGACTRRSIPLARPHGVHPFQIGARWWRFSATHRLPSVFPSGNLMHPSRVQIPRVFPAKNNTNGTMFRSGKAKALLPEGTPTPFPSETRGLLLFAEGTMPVASR
jgi:hypothetical protein